MAKINLLLFVSQFGQAGAERFAYEIDKALDRSRFDVEILSRFPLSRKNAWEDYYYQLHLDNGTKVDFLKPAYFQRIRSSIRYRLFPTRLKELTKIDRKLDERLNRYDVVIWMGEYIFNGLGESVSGLVNRKSLIYIMSSKAQTMPNDYYDNFDKSRKYQFASFFASENAIKFELRDFEKFEHHYFPLSFEISEHENLWKFKENQSKRKIGIFTRLSRLKPLDPFFYALHLLRDKIPNVELLIFGSGDPVASGVMRYIQNLHLEGSVKFMGHVLDISRSAVEAELDLIWFQSMHGMPGGFAGYDLCLTGIPQIYWEIVSPKAVTTMQYPSFSKLTEFVEKSTLLLTDKNAAEEQSRLQFEATKAERDIKKTIPGLEKILFDIVAANQVKGNECNE